ncbi:YfcC family protein [Mesoplasma seiffertii]|uniref:YfcC family protein n=1 Tax=Mesoplasma seiffertii TaxID=28224 RepID=UPI000688E3B3|nr:YfcC family protein [Mesoplasma seiffertii]
MDQNQLERLNDLKKNVEHKIQQETSSPNTNNHEHLKKLELLNISLQEINKRIDEYYQTNPSSSINGVVKKPKVKKARKMWAAVVILLLIVAAVVFVSWILQLTGKEVVSGVDENGNEIWVPIKALGIADIFYLPLKGFERQVEIVIFILMIGAFINVVVRSKALEGMAQNITLALKGKEIWAIVPLMLFFSICGSIEGMCEESLGFYAICIPLMLMAGFDTFTAFLIVFLGAGIGVVGSTLNPFAVTVAVNELNEWAKDPNFISSGDGLVWRFITWAILTIFAIVFTVRYAKKVKNNPQKSVVFATLEGDKKFFLANSYEKIEMNWKRKFTVWVFCLTFLLMLVYLVKWDSIFGITWFATASEWFHKHVWFFSSQIPGIGVGYLIEVATFFLIATIILGLVNGLGQEKFLGQFTEGAADYIGVIFVMATAAGVSIGIENSNLRYLITEVVKNGLSGIQSSYVKIILLFLIFIPISFLIPSTSGFSTLIFPLIAPIVAIEGETPGTWVADPALASGSIAAFVNANGFINLFSPMAAALMGGLALSRVDYGTFLKKMFPFFVGVLLIIMTMLCIGVYVSENISSVLA